jgi:transposase
MRPRGAPDRLEQRRRRAVQLLQAGHPMSAVAQRVRASVSSVWRWWQTYQRAGLRGLRPTPTPGRPPRLSEGQLRTLERILARGPRRAGYPTDLWTLARVAKVIQRQFRIRYDPSHVWRLLTARGWRCQPLELSDAEKLALRRMLQQGPRRAGTTLDRWTFGRVVELYRQEVGIYDPSRVRQVLTVHGWRCPPPDPRAEATIARMEWEQWPRSGLRFTTWRLTHRHS